MSGGSPWTGSPVTSSTVTNETRVSGENDSDLHHGHVKCGDLPEARAVHLLRTNLLQDDAGLVYITIEGGQVERRELVPEEISLMSVTQIDHDHFTPELTRTWQRRGRPCWPLCAGAWSPPPGTGHRGAPHSDPSL